MNPLALADVVKIAWENRVKILLLAIVTLAALCKRQNERIHALTAALDAKPKIEIRETVKTVIKRISVVKRVAGPVVIHEVVTTSPSGEKTTTRTIEKAATTTETATNALSENNKTATKSETPAVDAGGSSPPRWLAGASFDPWRASDKMLHIGVAIGTHLDITYGRSLQGRNDVRAILRF